jgi:hypothetical protein
VHLGRPQKEKKKGKIYLYKFPQKVLGPTDETTNTVRSNQPTSPSSFLYFSLFLKINKKKEKK